MRPDQLVPYHITSIFTSKLLMFFAIIFLFISILARQMELTALMLFVLFLPGAAYLWSRFAFSHLTFDFQLDKTRVFPQDPILVNISVTNNKLLPVWVQINSPFDDDLFFYETPPKETAFLLWFQTITIQWHLNPSKRGCFCIGQTNVTAADLFGFFPRQKTLQNDTDIIVFPKRVPTPSFDLKKHHFFGNPGSKSPVQDPVYIIGTREYQRFTPFKFIHWKASARLGLLQEKICEPSIQGKVLFIVDVSQFQEDKAGEEFERMLETIASMAIQFKRLENAVGFLTNATISGSNSPFVSFGRNSKRNKRIYNPFRDT